MLKAAAAEIQEAPLPLERFLAQAGDNQMAFHACGIDHTGPFQPFTYRPKDPKSDYKYRDDPNAKYSILVFSCPLTRAVHLELCDDQKLEGFMNAFDRFTNTHRVPQTVYLDNHNTQKAAARCDQNSDTRKKDIDWKFNVTSCTMVGRLL